MNESLTLHVSHGVLSGAVVRDMSRWIELRDERRVRLFLSDTDRLRLLRLRVWSIRYKISVIEILDLIVPPLRKKIGAKRVRGIGIPTATLTGAVAEEILKDRLAHYYPDGANITVWKERERERQLAAERDEEAGGFPVRENPMPSLLEVGDVQEYNRIYAERIRAARAAQTDQRWRKQRHYRNNPWR